MIHLIQVVHNQADKLRIATEKEHRKAAKKRLQNVGTSLKRVQKKGSNSKTKENSSVENASLWCFLNLVANKVISGTTARNNPNFNSINEEQFMPHDLINAA